MNYHRIELIRGLEGTKARPAVKQAIRFARRLRQRHIDMNVLSLFCDEDGVSIEVGRRVVRINSDGNIRQEMRAQCTSHGWRADPQGSRAQHARMHALYLTMAASGRPLRAYKAGRIMVDCARYDRMYGSIV